MSPADSAASGAQAVFALGRRIVSPAARRLFAAFCREASRLSDTMTADVSAYDVTFRDDSGFSLVVSPLRDLFIVSLGAERSSDIRVSAAEGFCFALDSAVRRRLAAAAAAASGRAGPPASA